MGKRLVISLIAVAIIIGVAFVVYHKAFDSGTKLAERAAETTGPSSVPTADAAPVGRRAIRVLRVEGDVERQSPDGVWSMVAVGDALDPDDLLRTGDDGSIEFDLEGKTIGIDSKTTLSIAQLADIDTIRLEQGRLSANVESQEKPLRVEISGSDAVAESVEGDFDVLVSAGNATVASRRGDVDFRAAGKSVKVSSGELSTARKGAAPTAAAPIPTSLFLKVRAASKTRKKTHTIRGETTPGAIISVNGVVVRVNETGEFTQVVALREGQNRVEILGRDVTGRKRVEIARVVVDTKAPEVGGKMNWGP